jgi:FSR family fosmidomycin resistance protein-like MFS transporter
MAPATKTAPGVSTVRFSALALVLFSAGHFFSDLYSGALGALQPLLVGKFHLTLAEAGWLGGMLMFSGSIMQPLYGYLSDRIRTRMFAVLGPAVAGVFISSLGLAPSYSGLMWMIILGGTGIAMFHPQASSQATVGIRSNRSRAMAVFISSGTLGFASGPAFFSLLSSNLGLGRLYWGAIPGVLTSLLLITFLPDVSAPSVKADSRSDWRALRSVWKPMTILYALVFIRSIIQVVFAQFIPLYMHLERGYSLAWASYTLSLYLAAGAVGGFLGGHLADRFGGRLVIIVSMIASVPFLLLFFLAQGWLSTAGLLLGGLILLFTIPVNVVMAQDLAPKQAGTVSALMMGFAWGMAGFIFVPLTGWLSDRITMHYALMSLTVFPLVGFLLSWRLPKHATA